MSQSSVPALTPAGCGGWGASRRGGRTPTLPWGRRPQAGGAFGAWGGSTSRLGPESITGSQKGGSRRMGGEEQGPGLWVEP